MARTIGMANGAVLMISFHDISNIHKLDVAFYDKFFWGFLEPSIWPLCYCTFVLTKKTYLYIYTHIYTATQVSQNLFMRES